MKILYILLFTLSFAISPVAEAGIINPVEIASDVTPNMGSHYLTDYTLSRLDIYTYNYIFDISNLDEETKSRCKTDMLLGILDISDMSSSDNWIMMRPKDCNGSKLTFAVNFTEKFKSPLFGEMRYRLYDKGDIIKEASGPEIVFDFRNEKSEKSDNNRYTYSVEVKSSINNSTICILYEGRDGKLYRYDETKNYVSNSAEWELLEWKNAPYLHRLEFMPNLRTNEKYLTNTVSPGSQRTVTRNVYNASTVGLYIGQTYSEDPSRKIVVYEIRIKNTGDIKTYNIRIEDILPVGMIYITSDYADSRDGILEKPKVQPNNDGTTTLTWSIGDLISDQSKTIRIVVFYTGESSGTARNKVMAIGSALGTAVEYISEQAEEYIDISE